MEVPNLNVVNTTNQLLINKASEKFLILHADSGVLQITRSDYALLVPQTKVKILSIGRQGPQGAPGLDGVGDSNYTHTQLAVSASWAVAHNLGKKPSVTIVDSGETKVIGDVTYTDLNNLVVNFSAPFGGKAFLN